MVLKEDRLSIRGEPEDYPVARTDWIDFAALDESQRKTVAFPMDPDRGVWGAWASGFLGINDKYDFLRFLSWEKDLKQLGKNNGWYLQSIDRDYGSCNLPGFAGFASGNSLLFSTAPPLWNPEDQTISYQMASLSKDETGNRNRGNFDLAMRRELIQCLWGFVPSASTSSEVTILYQDGRSSVGTSSLRLDGNWLYLKVTGFTFSNPTLKIRITPKDSKTRRTVICAKGTIESRVTGVKPRCPKGFQQRALRKN
ncbi:MAG: hypothetical protein ACKOFU_06855 [Actinomycetota bacterium]